MKCTYHTNHSYKDKDGTEVKFVTQLYQVGVYGIVNNNPALQGNFTPPAISKLEKKLKAEEAAGTITDLQFGPKIKVSDESGLWEEIT